MYFTPVPIRLTRTSRPTLWYIIVICLIAISIVITYYVQFLLRIEFEGVFFVGNNHMCTLAQYNPKVSQGAVSYNMSNLQQLHVFQFGHLTGRLQNKPQQVHVHVFQFNRFNVQKMYCYQVTFSSASLCIIMPSCCLLSPARIILSWLTTADRSSSSILSLSVLRLAI